MNNGTDNGGGEGSGEVAEPPYEVGHKRPPREHRFPPGVSGNPSGRKKKELPPPELLNWLMSKKVAVSIGGQREKLLPIEIAFQSILAASVKGNMKANELILKMALSQVQNSEGARLFDSAAAEEILRDYQEGLKNNSAQQ